jgi:hypothetical protein
MVEGADARDAGRDRSGDEPSDARPPEGGVPTPERS